MKLYPGMVLLYINQNHKYTVVKVQGGTVYYTYNEHPVVLSCEYDTFIEYMVEIRQDSRIVDELLNEYYEI